VSALDDKGIVAMSTLADRSTIAFAALTGPRAIFHLARKSVDLQTSTDQFRRIAEPNQVSP